MSSKKKAPKKSSAPKTKSTTSDGVLASPEIYAKFVKVWQNAASVKDVVAEMGMSKIKASAWSMRLRKAGVKLKKFRSGAFKVDVAGLNEIVKAA